jgi:hypothetical protein
LIGDDVDARPGIAHRHQCATRPSQMAALRYMCGTRDKVLGRAGDGVAANVHLTSTLPVDADSSRSWRFGFRNLHGQQVRITLYVVCTPVRH